MNDVPKNFYVYTLQHVEAKEEDKVFYIGRGSVPASVEWVRYDDFIPKRRYNSHMHKARTGSALPVHRKIRQIWSRGENVKLIVIAKGLSLLESQKVERDLIQCVGLDHLTNVSPGGDDFAWLWGHDKEYKHTSAVRTPEWIENHRKGSHKKAVVLIHSITGKRLEFDSLHSAGKGIGVDTNAIWQVLAGKSRTTKGYLVAYKGQPDPVLREDRRYEKKFLSEFLS